MKYLSGSVITCQEPKSRRERAETSSSPKLLRNAPAKTCGKKLSRFLYSVNCRPSSGVPEIVPWFAGEMPSWVSSKTW